MVELHLRSGRGPTQQQLGFLWKPREQSIISLCTVNVSWDVLLDLDILIWRNINLLSKLGLGRFSLQRRLTLYRNRELGRFTGLGCIEKGKYQFVK